MSRAVRTVSPTAMVESVRSAAVTVSGSVAALWLVAAIDWIVYGGGLAAWAIAPRTLDGLLGILFAPWLHGSLGHLVANTVGFVTLAPLTMVRRRSDFFVVSAVGALSSGLGAWALGGPGTLHLGASGVIFAYLGFLVARGAFERRLGAVLLSLLVVWLFGGMVWQVFPMVVGVGVSWQAHLFGFLGGIATARRLAVRRGA